MKLAPLVLALAGCSTVSSAVGSLVKPKPATQITIVNQVDAPAPAPAPRGPAGAMIGGGAIGAAAGGAAAAALHGGALAIASSALVGAGVGAALGYAVHDIR